MKKSPKNQPTKGQCTERIVSDYKERPAQASTLQPTEGTKDLVRFVCCPDVKTNKDLQNPMSGECSGEEIRARRYSGLTKPNVCLNNSTPTVQSVGIEYVFQANPMNDTTQPHKPSATSHQLQVSLPPTVDHARAHIVNRLPVRERLLDRSRRPRRWVVIVLHEMPNHILAVALRPK